MNFTIPREPLSALCARRHIRRLSLFGSALRADFRPESDVDMLIEFEAGHTPGLEFVTIEDELSALCGGHRVDLVNPKYLNRRLKDRVLAEAQVIYAQG